MAMDNSDIRLAQCRQADILVQILATFIKEDVEKYAKRHPDKIAGTVVDYVFSIPKRIIADIDAAKKSIKQSYIADWTIKDILGHFQQEYEGFGVIHTLPSQDSLSNQIEKENDKLLFTINRKNFEVRFDEKKTQIKRFTDANNISIIKSLKDAIPSLFPTKSNVLERKIAYVFITNYPQQITGKIIKQELNNSRKTNTKENVIRRIDYQIRKIGWKTKKERFKDSYSIIPTK